MLGDCERIAPTHVDDTEGVVSDISRRAAVAVARGCRVNNAQNTANWAANRAADSARLRALRRGHARAASKSRRGGGSEMSGAATEASSNDNPT
jgi:hypothetical protein